MKIEFTPVGVSFPDTAPNLSLLSVGSVVSFEHRPAFYGSGDKRKEYPNAIVVLFDNKKVGSLAESDLLASPQQSILRMIKNSLVPTGTVIEIITPKETDTFKKTYKLSVDIVKSTTTIITKKEIIDGVELSSFNEKDVSIVFEPIKHTYKFNGKVLTGATTYLKKYFKDFDLDSISKHSAKSWGVNQQDVVDLWDSNSGVSSLFGTAIHKALEHYEEFNKLGKTISDSKDMNENYALPKHPLLKQIVLDFIKINPIKGDVVSEVLLSNIELGICGQADRIAIIDLDKKICRIGDYKINVGAEDVNNSNKPLGELNYLPGNKISKYQIQMSIYANLLQKSGWTVLGLDVYILEDKWKYFALDVLNVLD